MNESDIQAFWNANPCGDFQVGGLESKRGDYEAFFSDYDRFRYRKEGHILRCLDRIDFQERDVLEIGLGQGADSEQIVRRGAKWSGLDLTQESIDRVQARFSLRNLPFQALQQGSVLEIPYADNSFDIVFSHGVLHHVPDILRAQREIRRILRPGGQLIVMVYAKWSLNYLISIALVRRFGLVALSLGMFEPKGILRQHLENARRVGLLEYLKMKNFIHRNTDGPLNPYSKVYDIRDIQRDFPDFEITKSYKCFMHAPPLPVTRLPLGHVLGWHLWVHMTPRPRSDRAESNPVPGNDPRPSGLPKK